MTKDVDFESAILSLVQKRNYRPVKARRIAKQLDVPRQRQGEVKKAIKTLVRRGKLAYGADRLVRPVKRGESLAGAAREVTGVFRRAAAGFGFVRPAGTPRADGRSMDVYIPARRAMDAASGDLVRVRLKKPRPGKGGEPQGPRGEVVEVLRRETHQFVGVYFERAGGALVQVDAGLFAQPVPVGDPGAKGVREGDKVVIEMVRFPSHLTPGEAVITEVLGPRGAPGVDTLTVLREFDLPESFPENVLEAARQQADRFDASIGRGRLDLTSAVAITIDPKDARDFDDAISLDRLPNGFWRLAVHIADVSHFVRPKSALDREARRRATSVYLPDRVIPMLPEAISNNLASLQPDRVRYAKTAFLEFAPEGVRTSVEVRRTAIRNQRRFTYEEVDDFLAHPRSWKKKLDPDLSALLGRMRELAMILRKRRLQRGSLELNMPEIRIELDEEGRVEGAQVVEHTESHQIIEEFMLAANEGVADILRRAEAPFLRRVHEPPDPKKLKALTQFARELGFSCESLESRFEIQRVLAEASGRPEEYALNYAVLRSMQKAVYSPEEEGHYALCSDAYCHFTSPIRRYPDLTVHRALDSLARGRRPPATFDQLALLGEHCSEREQRAEAAERELTKIKLLHYLSQRIGQTMRAVITGVEEFGIFAQGLELPAEGLIHVNSLQDDYYRYEPETHSLTGMRRGRRYRLGDVLQVEVFHVDIDRRQLDFRAVRRLARPGAEPRAASKAPPKKARAKSSKKSGGKAKRAAGRKRAETTRKKRK